MDDIQDLGHEAALERERRQRALHRLRLMRENVGARLELISKMVYRNRAPLEPFALKELDGPLITPPLDLDPPVGRWFRPIDIGGAQA